MAELSIFQVDAFTNVPFHGNPAGVCLLPAPAPEDWMQAVAAEMNVAETAFLVARAPGDYALRWFTPAAEVDLCGHATLASAHLLWEQGHVATDAPISFHSRSGRLGAAREGDWVRLDFPALPLLPVPGSTNLAGILGAQPVYVGRNAFPSYFVELESEEAVRRLVPDIARLGRDALAQCIVTARSASGDDFVSRFFAPGVGIDEDPVTGSAHCSLGPYWAAKLGKTELAARQLSRRGGVIKVRVRGDRVDILGQAVTVIRGRIDAP
jgi:predicted PhzF superfamily epimerase YddE/YHI9